MAQTVIGFFESASDAQRAAERLQSSGISRDRIDISSGGSSNTNVSNRSDNDSDDNGVTRFFKSLFGDDDNDSVERYSSVGRNSCIVTVHAQSNEEAEDAADILDEAGAIDVDERSSQHGYSNAGYSATDRGSSSDETTIDRVSENLEVGKREVERGGVRVRSRIVERPVEEHIRLREENVYVERNPVNRRLDETDGSAFQDRDIELTEKSEIPVVNKEARVVEEIRIGKEVSERDETIRDTVRETEVDIDNINDQNRNRTGLNSDTNDRGL